MQELRAHGDGGLDVTAALSWPYAAVAWRDQRRGQTPAFSQGPQRPAHVSMATVLLPGGRGSPLPGGESMLPREERRTPRLFRKAPHVLPAP